LSKISPTPVLHATSLAVMAIKQKLTPEAFLSAPSRGPAVPSPSGKVAYHTQKTHTFAEDGVSPVTTKKEVLLMDIGNGKSWSILDGDKLDDVNWVPDYDTDTLIWLKEGNEGFTEVRLAAAPGPDGEVVEDLAGVIPAPAQALKIKKLEGEEWAIAVICLADPENGGLYNKETAPKRATTARVYDDLRVRGWDQYCHAQKYSIFYGRLYRDYQWKVSPLQNALRGTDLQAPAGVYLPWDVSDGYDISQKGIVFTAKQPRPADPIEVDCSDVYYVPIESFGAPPAYKPTQILLQGKDFPGECTNVRFSPDGTMVAFLKAPLSCPPDTRLYMGQLGSAAVFDVFKLVVGEELGVSPDNFEYAPDGQSMFIVAQDCGHHSLFQVELTQKAKPKSLVTHGTVDAYYPLKGEGADGEKKMLLVSGNNFVESSWYEVVDLEEAFEPRILSTNLKDGAKFGLSAQKQVSEIWFEGNGDYVVQAWILKPSDFDEKKKYPLCMLVHGGPASAWKDQWHGRWNAAVWAEQGYVVVMPNFSGSTGFGLDHARRKSPTFCHGTGWT
jgi:hypothetical protein